MIKNYLHIKTQFFFAMCAVYLGVSSPFAYGQLGNETKQPVTQEGAASQPASESQQNSQPRATPDALQPDEKAASGEVKTQPAKEDVARPKPDVIDALKKAVDDAKTKNADHLGALPHSQNLSKKMHLEKPQYSAKRAGGTADHSKFKILQQVFATGSEVTKACLSCHTEAGKHVMKSLHWKWEFKNPKTGQKLGKKHLVNNFCTNSRGNEGMCAQCHVSYNYKDSSFDFKNQQNIDCLVCHDRTGLYYKTPTTKGNEACSVMFKGKKLIDLQKVAQNVGMPSRKNCGGCHFKGGGGDNVKHGDLSTALINPDKSVDVHMDAKGLNFACTACHVTEKHIPAGSRYDVMARDTGGVGKPGQRRDVATCESCHSARPHKGSSLQSIKLNGHTDKIACQTCHIPEFARGGVATMTDWDWRTAGKLDKNGMGYYEKKYTQGNGGHRKTYKSIKGSFKFADNVKPEYHWFNGQMTYTTIDTKFDPAKGPVKINGFSGSYHDPKSRIWPFKRMRTTQPYDAKNNTLVYTHLWGQDSAAYWGNYDMSKAVAAGMKKNNMPYSGKLGFIRTDSYWPITHMVSPKDKALGCSECHAKNGRLADLKGFYMPGRDSMKWMDFLAYLALAGAFIGVLLHGLLRFILKNRRASHS